MSPSLLVPPASDSEDENREDEEEEDDKDEDDLQTRKEKKTKPCGDRTGLSQDLDGKT